MNKHEMSLKLKHLRKANNLSIEDVKNLLYKRNINVAAKTIYGWESGNRLPYPDIFLTLCDIYNVEDILYTFGIKNSKAQKISIIARDDGSETIDLTNEEIERINQNTSLITSKEEL